MSIVVACQASNDDCQRAVTVPDVRNPMALGQIGDESAQPGSGNLFGGHPSHLLGLGDPQDRLPGFQNHRQQVRLGWRNAVLDHCRMQCPHFTGDRT